MSSHTSIQEAVAAAHAAIAKLDDSDKFEYISVIYEDPNDGKFKFTTPFTQEKRTKADAKITVPKGSSRALYHNHPTIASERARGQKDEMRDFFSPGDIDVSKRTGLQSFIGSGPNIFSWDPNNPGELVTFGGRGSTMKKQKLGKGTLLELNSVANENAQEERLVAEQNFKTSSKFKTQE